MHTSQISLASLSFAVFLLHTASAATTLAAVSEYPDGQPQAGSWSADSSSSWGTSTPTEAGWPSTSSYDNPFTIYTTMTNSLGVITGMPAVVTSQPTQPAVVTSQPISPTLPIYSGYYYNTTSSTSGVTTGPTTLATSNSVYTTTSLSTPVPTFAQVTGAASSTKIASAGLGLVVAALGFCLL